MKQRAVDAVHVLGHVLQHQHMAGQIGLPRRADQMAEDGEVERGVSRTRRHAGLERSHCCDRRARPARARPPPRRLRAGYPPASARARDSRNPARRARRAARPRRCSRDRSCRAPRSLRRGKRQRQNAAGAIAAAREPDGIERPDRWRHPERRRRAPRRRRRNGRRLRKHCGWKTSSGARAELRPRRWRSHAPASAGSRRDAGADDADPVTARSAPSCCSVTARPYSFRR